MGRGVDKVYFSKRKYFMAVGSGGTGWCARAFARILKRGIENSSIKIWTTKDLVILLYD